jgi:hypothetical protein
MSHKNEIKKAKEKFHFEVFKRLFTEFPLSDIDTCREHPDFLVDSLHGIIGIEHTKVFEDETIKDPFMSANKYGDQERILKKARIICEKKKIPPLWVRVRFSISNLQYTRKDVERISKSLADCIEKERAKNPSTDEIILRRDELLGIPEIQKVDIVKSLGYQQWEMISPHWVTREFIKEIQKCINDKNSLYAKYREHCGQCWLLMVVDRKHPSQGFELSEKTAKHTYKSAFDRTFYLELRFEQLVQLSCTKISPS